MDQRLLLRILTSFEWRWGSWSTIFLSEPSYFCNSMPLITECGVSSWTFQWAGGQSFGRPIALPKSLEFVELFVLRVFRSNLDHSSLMNLVTDSSTLILLKFFLDSEMSPVCWSVEKVIEIGRKWPKVRNHWLQIATCNRQRHWLWRTEKSKSILDSSWNDEWSTSHRHRM